MTVDRDGCIVLVNALAEQLFGWTREEMLGRPVEMLVPDRLHDRHRGHRDRYVADARPRPMGAELALAARRKDGSEFPVEISLSPIRTADESLVTTAIRDVSERKQAEAALQRLRDDLTDMVVHDLKNPVNGILMQARLALRKGSDLPETHARYMRNIERTCLEMLRLIVNLLEISKMEAGKMAVVREPVALADLAAEAEHECRPLASDLGKTLTVAVERSLPPAMGDPALLKRVLVNLIVNALRHSGSPETRLDAVLAAPGDAVVLRVVDRGRGMSPEQQARVFEKFGVVRRDLVGEPVPDTGLGLAFCKLAVEQMGGEIGLCSAPGQETVFTVTLPTR